MHRCCQQRGYPGIPLEQYGPQHLEREYSTVKPCAPFCTISCVHQVAMLDFLREKPFEALPQFLPASHAGPRLLGWLYMQPRIRRWLTKGALKILGVP